MKLFVAMPVHTGMVYADTVRSLLNEQTAAVLVGDEIQVSFLASGFIAHARNQLVAEFLKTDAEKLLFVDSDVFWDHGQLLRLARFPREVVGGAYRKKCGAEIYPVGWLQGSELWADANGLLEVASMPGGFLCIDRSVFAKFREFYGDRTYFIQNEEYYEYFHMPRRDKILFGEDSNFCVEWRAAGGRVWLNPELTLGHKDGGTTYMGHIGKWLKGQGGH